MAAVLSSFVSGTLLFLSFPKFDLWPLAWVAMVPLLVIVAASSPKQAFWYGWLTGTVYFLGCLYWVTHTMVVYGKLPVLISILIMFLLVIYLGIYVGLFTFFYRRVIETFSPLPHLLVSAALWVTLEWLRGHLLSGFPWALLGYSQYQVLPVIQIADMAGVYGISFLLVTTNVALAQIIKTFVGPQTQRNNLWQIWRPFLAGGILISLALIYGSMRLTQHSGQPISKSLKVGLIQGNIDQEHKWDSAYQRETLETYKNLTQQALSSASSIRGEGAPEQPFQLGLRGNDLLKDAVQGANGQASSADLDLVVWPEAATPFFFEQEKFYREELKAFTRSQRIPLLFGSPVIDPPQADPTKRASALGGSGGPLLFNSAYLLSPEGSTLARYDKIHLVPFGEYVPLASLLFFVHKLVEGIGDFGAGKEFTVMEIPSEDLALPDRARGMGASEDVPKGHRTGPHIKTTRFGVVICFEVIFPELVRQFVKQGADFMATLTNDAWFGRSSAPYQHFSMVVFRAVENRVPFIRAANTGITGAIDGTGRILRTSDIFTETYLVQEITLKEVKTFYTEYGDFFAYLCGIITLAILAYILWIGRKPLEVHNA